MKLTDIYRQYRRDIAFLEKEIEKNTSSEHPVLQQASSHIRKAGGKRIRPVFVLLSAGYGEYDLDRLKNVAVPLELIHMASLVHDDVIDDADKRRGKMTIKAKWDNRTAMYAGDYMFAKATEMAAAGGQSEVHLILSRTMREMCLGEIEQLRDQFVIHQQLRDYLRRIKRKTALLISASCELGAVVSGAEPQYIRALRQYGYYVGMAFQITDDILDFVGTEKELGKPAGSDLVQGNVTYPALYAMQRDEELRKMVTGYMMNPDNEDLDIEEVISRIRSTGAVEASKELADLYVQKAQDALHPLPGDTAPLKEIAAYIGSRKF
ncbi:polyprenyl synthetase family protein [Alkalicoccus chagannorensis]|uniref:polyprenyl synthetase family protein n=1 Tax=Alkalicoccus chagannorensis TaxID=427072 RepID=UPI0004191C52|nr:polyprenyl synthetase family protein [Alkalicoccus chagannorensis]